MDTKSLIIEQATALFQQKGYKGVGLTEILKVCGITKGSLYHHFPNGKEELLMACLQSMEEAITTDTEDIFSRYQTAQEATQALIEKLVTDFEREGTITGYTFSSIVSEIASLNDPVLYACSSLYTKIEEIYSKKLVADGFSAEAAHSSALLLTASIEGGIMLCLTKKSSEPLKTISQMIPKILKEFS
ncbi:TetR/AcrR family transcriptional regulator [Brevibacillus nitrificans]|uniref:TetR/AcrR family transcriptional regulator n=1 Tax=Brevibacillus nitrificans TaxID=651560 RepID=UPI00262B6DB8|nr:TetR/AcrR family transcriptional regulator [Brevibacillus nitrificans]